MADDLKFDDLMADDPDPFDPQTGRAPSLAANDEFDANPLVSLEEFDADAEHVTPVRFVTGKAGCGKTYAMKKAVEADPKFGVLVASTGIAAVNLEAQTIHSLLKYFDTASLKDNAINGRLHATLRKIARTGVKNIILDQVSMTPAEELDVITMALDDINRKSEMKSPLGFIIVGDFCQLPPVKADYAFKAERWPRFADNTERLTKNWRQSHPAFLDAINFLRAGQGREAADILKGLIHFHNELDENFDGTTIIGKNEQVDSYNRERLRKLTGKNINLLSRQWGVADTGAWKTIPAEFSLKEGAYVMILANSGSDLEYANGDTGHIEKFDGQRFHIRLVRNGEVVRVGPIHRTKVSRDEPNEGGWEEIDASLGDRPPYGRVSRDQKLKIWHVGGIQYYPVRAAYATTNHKCQGLSIDRAQIDIRNNFFGQPAMLYVSVSRCRTPEGLRIVGSVQDLIKRCNVDPEVISWL